MRRAVEIVRNRIEAMGTPLPELSLGVGLSCTQCSITTSHDGRTVWTFSTFPTVGRVEPGSIAARLGLQTGDTLKTIDDIPVNTAAGGERLAALVPGTTVKLGWSRAGATQSASVAIPPDTARSSGDAIRLSQTVGNVRVEVRGRQATWTRDPRTGALVITGDSIRVTVIPPDP
jgi:membrane-associated protease RseP (regulator of RpoE activity)